LGPVQTLNGFPRRWVLATSLGWLLGFGFVLVLAMAVEALAGGVQVVVGMGMGAGVGLVQGRLLRSWLPMMRWLGASTVGMSVPFLLQDLLRVAGQTLPTSLWIYVPIGGGLVGVMQAVLLARVSPSARKWIAPCVLGWVLPVVLIAIGDEVKLLGWMGGLLTAVGILLGGVLLGATTAGPMRSLLANSHRPTDRI